MRNSISPAQWTVPEKRSSSSGEKEIKKLRVQQTRGYMAAFRKGMEKEAD